MRKQNPKSYDYIESLMPQETDLMLKARDHSSSLQLEGISISGTEASILQFLLQSNNCRKVVEIGTLTGLSALYILNSIPSDGYLWTLEKSPEHAAIANNVLLGEIRKERCQVIEGDAVEKLPTLSSVGPFDAVFIDGNKAAYLKYFDWALANISEKGIIIVDNIFLSGAVWGGETMQNFNEKQINNVRAMNEKAFKIPKLISTIIPTAEGMLVCKKMP